jgi:putative tryptophan/tyrosine transport system substrate-binding protein
MTRAKIIAAWCLALLAIGSTAAAQQPAPKQARIGMLCSVSCAARNFPVLLDELRKLGWDEGSTMMIDRRAAEMRPERLPQLAAELVQSRPDLIIASAPQAVRAAKNATAEIPIVMLFVADPVGVGLAQSLARPGGNLTGVATVAPGTFLSKNLQLLRELLPTARRVAALVNPANEVASRLLAIEAPAAVQLGFAVETMEVSEAAEIPAAVAAAKEQEADALLVVGDPLFHSPSNRIPDLAAAARLPTLYLVAPRAVGEAGGLMSYSPDFDEIARRGAHLVDRILRGAAPADLPIEQPTTYQLVINLRTAKALGIDVPASLLARADAVIE